MVMAPMMVSPTETFMLTLMPTITSIFTEITETTETMQISIMVFTKAGEQVEWVMHQGGISKLHYLSNFDLALSY